MMSTTTDTTQRKTTTNYDRTQKRYADQNILASYGRVCKNGNNNLTITISPSIIAAESTSYST